MLFDSLPVQSKLTFPLLNKITKATVIGVIAIATTSAFANDLYDDMDEDERIVNVIKQGNITQIEQLFADGLTINGDIEKEGTPLIVAVQSGNKRIVEYMLEQGADINLESARDGNPLIVAAQKNNLELVKYLHSNGAEIDAITKYDETALITASRAGHFDVVKYLVENGADVNLAVMANVRAGQELRSPLNGAKTTEIRNYLLAQGAKG